MHKMGMHSFNRVSLNLYPISVCNYRAVMTTRQKYHQPISTSVDTWSRIPNCAGLLLLHMVPQGQWHQASLSSNVFTSITPVEVSSLTTLLVINVVQGVSQVLPYTHKLKHCSPKPYTCASSHNAKVLSTGSSGGTGRPAGTGEISRRGWLKRSL